jgi:hypothetical protein
MPMQNTHVSLGLVVLVLVIGIAGYYIANRPDDRDVGEKLDDAISELEDRTPAERLHDTLNTND